ncbi:VIT domain-containing protein [Maribacter aquivivus]|uniref:VIT domain-containing protein n=1 Tax=Maribacter aquivivus TaxID=228958 RepID=UPI00248F9AA3|nr:VIT domain-containing protein [Maribacter aquivivus]
MKKLISLIFLFICTQFFAQESLEIVLKDSSKLKLTSLKIDVTIIGNFATTTYDMKFYNELDRTLEGELVFPLGEGQSVSKFAMDVNDKLREAVIVEKELARVAFESTIRQNIDPGLLEKTEGNNYKARIYPILPKKYKHIVLTFEQELSTLNQRQIYELALGMKAKLDNFSIQMNVLNEGKLPKIKSDNENFFFKESNGGFTASLEKQNYIPNSPVIVELSSTGNAETLLSYQDYFYINQTLKPNTRLKQKPKKIKLLWDTSYSLRNRNVEKELAILGEYFDYLRNVEVNYISFSNSIVQTKIYKIENGDWQELKEALKEAVYDGGTCMDFSKSLAKISGETLLFTDGLANLGDYASTNNGSIYTINSITSANHELLREVATVSGGSYINLVRLPQTEALNILKHETFQFLGYQQNNDIWEVYPNKKTNVSEDFTISGRFSKDSTIELLFGYSGKITERIKLQINKNKSDDVVKRLWAKQKLKHLNSNKDENKEEIISLAKSHYLVTDYTSMLILDRVEDYAKYRIEPPQELRAQYKELIKDLEEDEAYQLERLNDRKKDLFSNYDKILNWYSTNYPKKTLKQKGDATTNNDSSSIVTNTTSVDTIEVVENSVSPTLNPSVIGIDSTKRIITGTIVDQAGLPLPAANVVVQGTANSVTTDFDGNFSINAEENDELEISYIGFNSLSQTVTDSNNISISLDESSESLEEIIVVGYGTEVKREMTGSVTINVAQALQGKVAGVQVTQISGEPGSDSNITVRGINSVTANNSPLYVVDGEIVSNNPMDELQPEDIDGMQVLKALNAASIYGARASNGVVIITTKKGLETNQEAIEKFNQEISDQIDLKSWNPDTPYIKILEKEPNTELAYCKYLEIRDEYSNSPSFYLDVSDFFERKGKSDIAIRILTNLMEIELSNHELMKALGYKLEYFNQYELAVIVYKKVLELRPEEPQSYRDLALAYEQLGEIQKGYDLLFKLYNGDLLEKDEDDRFNGIEQIAYVELSRLVYKYGDKLKLKKEEKEKFKPLETDVRIVIDWNHNDTDIDLWVVDPKDEKANYSNQETKIGGHMSEDMTEGYGPEEFMLKNAIKGEYKILVDYYADDVQKISGPTVLKITMFTNYGKPNEERKTTVVRLDKEKDELEVGSLRF